MDPDYMYQQEYDYRNQDPVRLPRFDPKNMGSQIRHSHPREEYAMPPPSQEQFSVNALRSNLQDLVTKKTVYVPKLRIFLAEFLGTGALMFVGCMGGTPLAFGFAIVLIVQVSENKFSSPHYKHYFKNKS